MDELQKLKAEVEILKKEVKNLKELIGAEDHYCGNCGEKVFIEEGHWFCPNCYWIDNVVSIPF